MIRAVIDHTIATGQVGMDEKTMTVMHELRQFMFDNVYLRPEAEVQKQRAILVIRNLIDWFVHHPDEVPEGKLDMLMSIDFRMTSTTLFSDVVLPAATWYEKGDLSSTSGCRFPTTTCCTASPHSPPGIAPTTR